MRIKHTIVENIFESGESSAEEISSILAELQNGHMEQQIATESSRQILMGTWPGIGLVTNEKRQRPVNR